MPLEKVEGVGGIIKLTVVGILHRISGLFENLLAKYATLAQLVEQLSCKQ
jgi:hypothetical protein